MYELQNYTVSGFIL